MLHTPLCAHLGIDVPIILAPMGPDLVTPDLAAAVSNAGGLGLISFGGYPPPLLRQRIQQVRELTSMPFGVNVVLDPGLIVPVDRDSIIQTCLDERVPVLSLAFGDPSLYVEPAHAAGVKVIHQVGSVTDAMIAAGAGVDVIIAQGVEAGGHLSGTVTTFALVPRVVDAVAPTPVVAAGGIADARGVVAALALGADGVVVGTRFLATPEAAAHPVYKNKLLAATEEDTVRTLLYGGGWPNTPHRVLRTPFVAAWLEHEVRGQEQRPDASIVGTACFGGQRVPVLRFGALPPATDTDGDLEEMCFLAGQGVGLIDDIKPAAAIMAELTSSAQEIIERQLGGVVALVSR
ncbi:MAG TPA: nitronate monooxygenase [Thermomicrobiales bacterium]|nr:nitronate monooxygenase [Thermomicrobiales bacterium]